MERPGPEETVRCWQALNYTKPKTNTTTPTLQRPQEQITSPIEEQKGPDSGYNLHTGTRGRPGG